MRMKLVMRRDTIQGFFRLFRLMWERGVVGDGSGYSAKLSVALTPRTVGWGRDADTDWRITLFGLRLHYCRSYGGIFAAILCAVILALLVTGAPGSALADIAPTAAAQNVVDLGGTVHDLFEWAIPIVGVIVVALVGWLVNLLSKKTGLNIDAAHRDALATWAGNQAGAFLAAHNTIKDIDINVSNPAIAQLANTALSRIPDAMKYFGLTPDQVAHYVVAKIGILTAASTMPQEVVAVTPAPAVPAAPAA